MSIFETMQDMEEDFDTLPGFTQLGLIQAGFAERQDEEQEAKATEATDPPNLAALEARVVALEKYRDLTQRIEALEAWHHSMS